MTSELLDRLGALAHSTAPEAFIRTLLSVLQATTGLETTYLTRVDAERRSHTVPCALNTEPARLLVPEANPVPWADTVCRRALDQGIPLTQHADVIWQDLDAVWALGLCTYLGEPVRDERGTLLGTLCGVSPRRVPVPEAVQPVASLFARLIAHQAARERQVEFLSRHARELTTRVSALARHAMVDPLTGLPNRRALDVALDKALAEAAPAGARVAVVFVDLDRFKAINDVYGHEVGDRFLAAMAERLRTAARQDEFVARYGGDEFVGVVRLAAGESPGDGTASARRLGQRFTAATRGPFSLGEVRLDYEGASVGVALSTEPFETPEALLKRADAAMFAIKRSHARLRQQWLDRREATLRF